MTDTEMITSLTGVNNTKKMDWVPETRFGKWFISTNMWLRYVLRQATQDMHTLLQGRLKPGARILDAGCGIGLSLSLLEEFFQPACIVGMDVDGDALQQAATRRTALSAQLELLHCNAKCIPLVEHSLDAIYCHQLIHHVMAQEQVLAELYRILKPGGFLLSSESCEPFINSLWVKMLFRHPEMAQKTADGYLELIRKAGFEIAETDVLCYTPWWSRVDFGLLKKWRLSSWEPGVTEVITVAQKPIR